MPVFNIKNSYAILIAKSVLSTLATCTSCKIGTPVLIWDRLHLGTLD